MKLPPLEVIEYRIPGTSRQKIKSARGTVLERQNLYLKAEAWEALAELSKEQGVSGSVEIAQLIWQASKHNPAHRQAKK